MSAADMAYHRYTPSDRKEVLRIFREGMTEMVTDTAFRGLLYHPESQLLYTAISVTFYVFTGSVWLVCCILPLVLGVRYYYSQKVVNGYLERAQDIHDIDQYYMESSEHHLWVAEIGRTVVGLVAVHCLQDGNMELDRMSVDRRFRRQQVGVALGQQVLRFTRLRAHSSSSVVLGTTAYTAAPHRLYQSLGFRCVGITNGFCTPGTEQSLLERAFYRVRHHHYKLDLQ
ncbi:N-acetylaspartate synthetase-like isoform X2 [Sardina pilchardus]|uniref:N-acetylaspartate synthetase-like isoform X2 n=1 Tax=Sardina pilchardus TaxID=27697 RepID=UPI002E160C7A